MAKRLSQNDFIERISEIHGNKYDYSKVVYKNTRTKIILICPIHGDFEIKPDNILTGQGCGACSRDKHKLIAISNERLESLKRVHNNKYIYQNLQIVNGNIEIICPDHGKFVQSIYNHEYGHGCNQCNLDSRKIIKYRVCTCCKVQKEISEYNPKFRICNDCHLNKPIPDYKTCNNCGIEKEINLFPIRRDSIDKHRNDCIECYTIYRKPLSQSYKKKNRKILQLKDMAYRKKRMSSDPLFRAKIDARNVIRKSLSKGGYSKKSKTESILGCSYDEFKLHLESLFLPEMSWENRNTWHIDHIIPISFANSEKELLQLNHYKNLRPLWGQENLSKGDQILIETEIYDSIIEKRHLQYPLL